MCVLCSMKLHCHELHSSAVMNSKGCLNQLAVHDDVVVWCAVRLHGSVASAVVGEACIKYKPSSDAMLQPAATAQAG